MRSLLCIALIAAALAVCARAQAVPENFECPPGSPLFDSQGVVCDFTISDWMECIYSNIDQSWRIGCTNTSRYSAALALPPATPTAVTVDEWSSCNGQLIDPYYDLTCMNNGTRNCFYNALRNDYIVNCSCTAGWSGLRCERCVSDGACSASGAGEALPCDTSATPVLAKYLECNATDDLIKQQIGAGRIAVGIFPVNGTGSATIYARQSGMPLYFACNVSGCAFSVLEEAAGNTYVYTCATTQCACPFLPGTNRCKDQATEDTVAILKTRSSVRCFDERGSNGYLRCVYDQAELGLIINLACTAGECAQPAAFVSQSGSVVGQIVAVFLALLVLMALPALLWLAYRRCNRATRALAPKRGARLEFAALRYEIELGSGAWLPSWLRARCCRPRVLRVLDDVYGCALPGELVAILGESGSGKTSLLDLLAGMDKAGAVQGQILLDGRRRPRDFKRVAGYVQQHDAMLGTLTVHEQLMYSAQLRLPASVSRAEKERLVAQTMQELGLAHRRDTLIGSSEQRGLSGGEQRRTSIATELVSQPRVLFLDEPTSGLDAARALSVMTMLQTLAAQHGQTVVCSIHQPRSNIFQLFDRVILLAKGRVVYSGRREHVVRFFAESGYACPAGFNHADFLIDTVTQADDAALDKLADRARRFYAQQQQQQQQQALKSAPVEEAEDSDGEDSARPNSAVQAALLTHRAFLNLWRNPVLLRTHAVATIVIALFLGLAYLNLATNISGFQNRAGSLFFVITMLSFSCLSALDLFISERPIFVRERANGCYDAGPYFVAKIFSDLLPLRVLLPTVFATIMFWMAAYSTSVVHFVRFLLVIVLVNFTCASMLFVVSALSRSLAAATFLSSIIILVMLLFGGLLLNFNSIPVYIRWLRYLSFLGYAYEAVIVNELAGLAIDVDISAAQAQGGLTLSGSIFLEAFSFKVDNYWPDVGVLAMWGVLYLILAYAALRLFVKYKN